MSLCKKSIINLFALGSRHFASSFTINEKQKILQKIARKFSKVELSPVAAKYDELEIFPEKSIQKIAEKGWMGLCIDEKYGGIGLDLLSASVIIEELSRCCASTGIIVSIHNCLYAELVQRYGSLDQIEEFVRPFTNGQIGAFALSEHDAGSDAANLSTTAIKDNNEYILNGCKAWVTSGNEAKAAVIFATVDKNLGHKGITAFLVPLNLTGVNLTPKVKKLGIKATSTCDIQLNDVRVPDSNVIGGIGNGFKIVMSQMQIGRIGVAAQALGIAQSALDLSVQYANDRYQFGQNLTHKQLVKSKIAKIAIDLEAARLLTHKAASLRDNNEDFRKFSSMAKYAASRCATESAHNCVQIHGAKGFTCGSPERLYRDSRITQIYGGATDIQKMIIADLAIKESLNEGKK